MRRLSYLLSVALIFSIPFENIIDVPGVGTLSRALGVLLAAFWLAAVVVTRHYRQPALFHLLAALFALWNAASLFWSADFELTLEHLKTYAQLILLSLILWDLYRTETALRTGLQAYVLGAYVAIASTASNYFAGVNSSYQRFTGAGFNADDLGIFLALGLPLAWYLQLTSDRRPGAITAAGLQTTLLRLINLTYIPAAMFAIALSGTRTALLAALPAVVFMLLSSAQLRPSRRLALGATLVAALIALLPFIPEASLTRLASVGSELSEGSLNGRTRLWSEGLQVLLQQPLAGVGSNAYRAVISTDNVAHNAFISVLVETGVIGFALFATLLTLTVTTAFAQPRLRARLWLTVLAVWLCGAMALTIEHRKQTWLVFNLVVCAGAISRQPLEHRISVATPA